MDKTDVKTPEDEANIHGVTAVSFDPDSGDFSEIDPETGEVKPATQKQKDEIARLLGYDSY